MFTANQLRNRYIVALSVIALLTIFSQIVVQFLISDQEYDSRIINIAGRQRMLSQKITKTSFYVARAETKELSKTYRQQLNGILTLWERSHRGLQHGDRDLGLPGRNSNEVLALFARIEPDHRAMVTATQGLLTASARGASIDQDIRQLRESEAAFLQGMDEIVFLYDKEAKHKVAVARWLELALMVLTLAVLALEALFIFAPVTRRIRHDVQALEDKNEDMGRLFSANPSAILLVDNNDLTILEANQKASDLIGIACEVVAKGNLRDYLAPEHETNRLFLERIMANESLNDHEVVVVIGARNNVINGLVSVRGINFGGRTVYAVGITNISELRKAQERLEGLYEVSALVAKATALDDLAQGFVKSVARIAHADGATVRWSDENNQRYLMLAAQGMPQALVDTEQCLDKGECYCGAAVADPGLRVIAIRADTEGSPVPCARAGFKTVINIPVRVHERPMGEIDLFFKATVDPTQALRSLLEALGGHLASAMENLRLNALEREAAVAQERVYIARELHDSIAQSLAFTKIQVQLMSDALRSGDSVAIEQVLDEIDTGVRESYGDVRELLLHFRTRANAEDIEPALATTLRKFEHQSGVSTTLAMHGRGMPLSADRQIQVLHIVQEALSNVRKHARAAHVVLDVEQQPAWRFEVNDDGVGFEVNDESLDETHVGLRIMKERAERLGAILDINSRPGQGSSVVLTLSPNALPMAALDPEIRSASS